MTSKLSQTIILELIAVAVLIGVFAYPLLPAQIASHWNIAGEVNGHMSKFWGIFLLPMIMVAIFIIRFVVLKVDPLTANIDSFKKYYEGFWIFLIVFFLYVYILIIALNLGYRFDLMIALTPAMAALFYMLGVIMGKTKRNWSVGIRTPWTLSSDVVWDRTHQLAGKLFKIAGIVSLLAIFFRGKTLPVVFLIGPVLVASLASAVYSYVVFKQEVASK